MLLVEMVADSLHLPARHMAATLVELQAHNQQEMLSELVPVELQMLVAAAVVTGAAVAALRMPAVVVDHRLPLQGYMASYTHAVLQAQWEMVLFESRFLQLQPCQHLPNLRARVGREQVN
jgi:hypothetical protein